MVLRWQNDICARSAALTRPYVHLARTAKNILGQHFLAATRCDPQWPLPSKRNIGRRHLQRHDDDLSHGNLDPPQIEARPMLEGVQPVPVVLHDDATGRALAPWWMVLAVHVSIGVGG